ncbi:hypothetical protein [Roseateles sp. L2-2]|uniref:hypothetical protein n=1 Tax=Roseateles sp. L2-2 TaxID=3422597 RepID=UPI003D36AAF2
MVILFRRALQAFSVALLVAAVILAGESGFSAEAAMGPVAMVLIAGATMWASRFIRPWKSPDDSSGSSADGDHDLHCASVLADGGHGSSD